MIELLATILGGDPASRAAAEEWYRQAIRETTGRDWPHELEPAAAALAHQRLIVAVGQLTGDDLTFDPAQRERVRAAFRHGFGVTVPGPPWRAQPHEHDRPTYEEWADADFT